jgi:predicted RNA binding protein YcfA (HicA-like mRNA interferase family)
MDFGEVQVILEFLGYLRTGGKGSHFVFSKPGAYPITIVKEGGQRVKKTYLKKVVALLDLEETDEK